MMKRLLLLGLACVFVSKVSAQCTGISLTTNKKQICAPGMIEFKVTGAPKGSSYQWDIGQGSIPGVDTIYGFYSKEQSVNAIVNIKFPNGSTCVLTENNIAKINGEPVPSFDISRKLLCDGPDTVQFKNTTPNSKTVSWVIDGSNYHDSGNDIIHKYSTSGKKDVYLIVTDNNGCRGITHKPELVDVRNDVDVDFIASTVNGCVPKVVNLSNKVNRNSEKIKAYSWHYEGQKNDSSFSPNPKTLHYNKSGQYSVSLEVVTDRGCVHKIAKKDYLQFGDTTSLDIMISDSLLCINDQINIKTKSELPGSYVWTMEGSTDTIVISKSELQLTYDTAGKFDLGLWYSHNACVSKTYLNDKIDVNYIEADFESNDNYHCLLPHTTNMINKTISSGKGKVDYKWTYFETGTENAFDSSTMVNDKHIDDKWGIHDVQLVAIHENGCTDTAFKKRFVRVDSIRPFVHAKPRIACVDQTISFFNGTPKSSYMSKDTIYWRFFEKDDVKIKKQSRDEMVQLTYGDTGLYDVMIYVGNTIGCRDSALLEDYVDIIIPNIDYIADKPIICADEVVRLESNSTPARANFGHYWVLENKKDPTIRFESDSAIFHKQIADMGEYNLKFIHHLSGGCKDSIVEPNTVKVNGLTGYVRFDSIKGCTPFSTGARFIVYENVHHGFGSNDLKYDWRTFGSYDVDDRYGKNALVKFNSPGGYRVYFEGENSSGCKASISSSIVKVGVEAGIGEVPGQICVGQEIGIKNNSNEVTNQYDWNIIPSSHKVKIVNNDSGITLIPLEAGFFKLQLVASRFKVCTDTAEVMIEAQEVISDFTTIDTNLYCAPVYAQFHAKSIGADSFFWSFGDGTTIETLDKQIANIYNKNSGHSKGYDIQLISKNLIGCTDTITKNDLIKVLGPLPEFEMKNNYGCEPLEVEFINKSKDVHRYQMDYRDGTTLDSNGIYKHIYNIENSQDRQSYLPVLYAQDSLGCVAIYEPENLVSVLRKPDIQLNIPNPKGCAPHAAYFDHTTLNTTSNSWYVNDTFMSDQKDGDYTFEKAGNYTLKVIVSNNNLCTDSAFQNIEVVPSPTAKIVFDEEPCLNQLVGIEAVLDSANHQIQEYFWNFDDGQPTTGKHRLAKTANTYSEPGDKDVSVRIIDKNNCAFTIKKKINIPDPNKIPYPSIRRVTVTDDQRVLVEWEKVKDSSIVLNRMYKDGFNDANGNPAVFFEQNNNDTLNYKDDAADVTVPNCYTMVNVDRCEFEGRSYTAHCPVILSIQKTDPSKLKLTWTPYKGWLDVQAYDIYRANNGSAYEKIMSIDGYIHEFEDQYLCTGEYSYYVVAKFEDLESFSNTVSDVPDYDRLKDRPFVKNVTVINEGEIKVTFNKVENPNWEAHILSKYNSDRTELLEVIETYDDVFIDKNAEISSESYTYQLAEKDRCGQITLPGYIGKSILLDGAYVDDKSVLTWNSYEKWENGVENYHLQIRKDGMFEEVSQLAPSQLAYNDGDPHSDIHDQHCYRVMAISRNVTKDTSYSNIVCTVGPSKVWVPNAFTPNDDGRNDVFKPEGQFLKDWDDGSYREYSMCIYNRWGQKLFETDDIDEGWNGIYQGEMVIQDTYFYKIEISGVDQKVFRKKGPVVLIK